MKQPKKLTRRQKEIISSSSSFNPKNWRLVSQDNTGFTVINIKSKARKSLVFDNNGKYYRK